jgi:predicted TIM-barrel fold metal-dependent hydrolase
MLLDIHQHLWTARLLGALAARESPPLIRRSDGLTVLHTGTEQPYVIDVPAESPAQRAALVRSDGLDLALIALSSPVGIEALPRESALELIDAHLTGVAELPAQFAAWGPVALDRADAHQIDALLARGCAGVSIPAGALAGPDRLNAVGELLERTAVRQVPLFVHPGPGRGPLGANLSTAGPAWWPALTDYVAQMHAAWLTFVSFGRREHPGLVVIFAMLAGGAPLLSERLESRGGPPIDLKDPLVFYDTSSYGLAAVEMMSRRVGETQLLYGSDRPVVEPNVKVREARLQPAAAALFPSLTVAA